MGNCRQCGKKLPSIWSTDTCLECSEETVRKIFKENPEVKQIFRETIEDMKMPETRRKMVTNTITFMERLQNLQNQKK